MFKQHNAVINVSMQVQTRGGASILYKHPGKAAMVPAMVPSGLWGKRTWKESVKNVSLKFDIEAAGPVKFHNFYFVIGLLKLLKELLKPGFKSILL